MEFAQVVIVGGGVAGLSAAKTLGSKTSYVLIEAQNYLGGRILTVDAVPSVIVDLGAQYVHGDKNSLYKICDELDIILSDDEDSDDDTIVVTSNGKHLNSKLFEKAHDFWKSSIDKAEEKYHDDDDDETTSVSLSFADFVPEEFRKRLLSSSSFSRDLIEPIIDYFIKSEMMETACSTLSDLNLIEYVAYEDLEGRAENDLKNGGFRPFINYLKYFIPNDNRIRLNCEVTNVKLLNENKKLLIQINDHNSQRNKSLICDYIIWTTSLGYLKTNFHRIFGEITDLIHQKENAIGNIGFGTVNKVIMVYKNRFWNQKAKGIALLHTEKRQSFKISDILKQQLNVERVNPEIFEEIVNMIFHYDVLPSTNVPILICWFVGSTAEKIEHLSTQLIGQICHEVLCDYLNISHEKHSLVNVLKSGWHSNKYIQGSYSFYSMRSNKRDRKQLRAPYAPDGVPRILFAGEATHEKYYATINAALETGIETAKKILSIID